jgi:AsmA protein
MGIAARPDVVPLPGNVDMRALKIAGAVVAAIIVVLALALIVGIPSGFLTSGIEDRVERETGYQLTIAGTTKVSLWPSLNVTLSDITVQDPKDRDGAKRVTIASVQADIKLSSIWSGHPRVSELIITNPVVHRPLLRERTRIASPASKPETSFNAADAVTIDRVKIVGGAIVLANVRDRVERRIDNLNADAVIDAERKVKVTGTARAGDEPLKFDIKTAVPAPRAERQNVPIELTLDAPSLLRAPLSSKADVRLNGSVVMINGITGTIGDGAFNGWASVDVDSKPLVKVDLDFQRLDLAVSKTASQSGPQPWSDAPINLTALNYVDAQVRVSAAQLGVADARFSQAGIDVTLAGGVLKASVSNLGAYGGQASGEAIVDVSSGSPSFAMHCDLVGVRALQLLDTLADFDKIDGKMQAKIAVRSAGTSQQAIMSNLAGTAFVNFQDGTIRGLNLAQMIRSLTAKTLNGWQEANEQATDLTQLSASFRIDRGQATTTDLNLVGPLVKMTGAGTIDVGTKMLAFRVEPKLVMTTEGQGRTSDPIGLGIPVIVEGPWAQPRIYPEMAGILDNPDAAYAKLKEMGKGLFGANGGGLGGLLGSFGGLSGNQPGNNGSSGTDSNGGQGLLGGKLGETLGNIIQQGLGGQGLGGGGRGRSIPPRGDSAPAETQAAPPPLPPAQAEAQSDSSSQPAQDSQPMNDVLRQLFNRSQN